MNLPCFIAYDPDTETPYVNGVGSSAREASVAADLLGLSEEIFERLEYLPAQLSFDTPETQS